jgi:hypothetical protein
VVCEVSDDQNDPPGVETERADRVTFGGEQTAHPCAAVTFHRHAVVAG